MVKLNYFTRIVLTMVLFLGVAKVSAHDFEIDGIYYSFNDDGTTVSVASPGEGSEEYSGAVIIPSSVIFSEKTYSVVAIDAWAFFWCENLTSVVIPNSVTAIGDMAFYQCERLESIEIPNTVRTIGDSAFEGCYSLSTLEIPNSVTTIGDKAFYWCYGLNSISIGDSVTRIGDSAFFGCRNLTSVKIPNSVTLIEDGAFAQCINLESIIVGNNNTVYDSRDNCNAIIETSSNTLITGCNSTVIPNSVSSIAKWAFNGCVGLKSIEISNAITSIRKLAFMDCYNLETILVASGNKKYDSRDNCNAIIETSSNTLITGCKNTAIPNSVTSISECAFYGSSLLTSIVIPNSVTSIGYDAFFSCKSLMSLTSCNSTPPSVSSSNVFKGVPEDCMLYVPDGSIGAYSAAEGWSRFTNIRELPAGVEGVAVDDVMVRGENGVIRIEGADGAAVEVFNASGVCVFSGVATEIPVAQRGIYVVKVAGRATKIAL